MMLARPRPIGVNEDKLGLAMLSLEALTALQAQLLADALQQAAVGVVVGEEGQPTRYFQLGDFGLAANGARDEVPAALGAAGRQYSRP